MYIAYHKMSLIQNSQATLIIISPASFRSSSLMCYGWNHMNSPPYTLPCYFHAWKSNLLSLTSMPGPLPPPSSCSYNPASSAHHTSVNLDSSLFPEPPLCLCTSVPLLRMSLQLECSSAPSLSVTVPTVLWVYFNCLVLHDVSHNPSFLFFMLP